MVVKKLVIALSSEHKISLLQLIGDAMLQQQTHEPLHLVLTIAPQVVVSVIDDLPVARTIIEFILEKESQLTYELKATEGLEQVLTKKLVRLSTHTDLLEKEVIVRLQGSHAKASIKVTCFGFDQKVFKFKTVQDHQAEHAKSNVIIKSVLEDQAKLFSHSLIHVHDKAHHSVADQVNKNILLSSQARAVSIPTLEVLAHDVRCKHGAAISKLDDEQIFYAQSRGIDAAKTKQMLIEAFLN